MGPEMRGGPRLSVGFQVGKGKERRDWVRGHPSAGPLRVGGSEPDPRRQSMDWGHGGMGSRVVKQSGTRAAASCWLLV